MSRFVRLTKAQIKPTVVWAVLWVAGRCPLDRGIPPALDGLDALVQRTEERGPSRGACGGACVGVGGGVWMAERVAQGIHFVRIPIGLTMSKQISGRTVHCLHRIEQAGVVEAGVTDGSTDSPRFVTLGITGLEERFDHGGVCHGRIEPPGVILR